MSPPPPLETPSSIANHLISILTKSGDTPYTSEKVSELQHSLQCAHLAKTTEPAVDEQTVVAALLHDIGQIVPEDDLYAFLGEKVMVKKMEVSKLEGNDGDESEMGRSGSRSVGRVGHETLGAQYLLSLGFSEKVARLVESHVAAKRYLCATDKNYWHTLSDTSKKSLEFQGGPMTDEEKELFERNSWCQDMCRLRKWDDSAKVYGLEVPGIDAYRGMIERVLGVVEC